MNPQVALIGKLQEHPELTFAEAPGFVRIEPPTATGFAVELCNTNDEWTVFLGEAGFHEAFASADEVLNFIAWCYSGEARLRELWRGNSPQKAILESYEKGEWRFVSETGFFVVPFWRPLREVVLANPNILKH